MTFLSINALWLLLLAPVSVFIYLFLQRRRKKFAWRYSSLSLVKAALGKKSDFRKHIPPILLLIGLITMVFAMSRPVGTLLLPSRGGTIILAIDVSLSMGSADIKPNRFEAAKLAAKDFINRQPGNVNIGIVTIAGMCAVAQPATTDRDKLYKAIDGLMLQERTAIGSGISTSLEAILDVRSNNGDVQSGTSQVSASEENKNNAAGIVILLSDGQSNWGLPPLYVVGDAKNSGVPIYTVGMGRPENSPGFRRYQHAELLDEETLMCIADETDGQYYRAENATSLNNIYKRLGNERFFKPEETELTAEFTGLAAVFALVAGVLSLLWSNRL
jgi:Ca-activated chloride channel family protein